MSHYGWNIEGLPHQPPLPETAAALTCRGYAWRPGQCGQVQGDAVRAGVDKSGEPIYVGRANHEGDIVPAKIVPSHGGAYVPWGGLEHKKVYYEVLCANRVCWVSGSDGGVPADAVPIGTTEEGEKLFVGRVLHDGTLTPGKVHGSHGCCYIPYGGQELSFRQYEVLVID